MPLLDSNSGALLPAQIIPMVYDIAVRTGDAAVMLQWEVQYGTFANSNVKFINDLKLTQAEAALLFLYTHNFAFYSQIHRDISNLDEGATNGHPSGHHHNQPSTSVQAMEIMKSALPKLPRVHGSDDAIRTAKITVQLKDVEYNTILDGFTWKTGEIFTMPVLTAFTDGSAPTGNGIGCITLTLAGGGSFRRFSPADTRPFQPNTLLLEPQVQLKVRKHRSIGSGDVPEADIEVQDVSEPISASTFTAKIVNSKRETFKQEAFPRRLLEAIVSGSRFSAHESFVLKSLESSFRGKVDLMRRDPALQKIAVPEAASMLFLTVTSSPLESIVNSTLRNGSEAKASMFVACAAYQQRLAVGLRRLDNWVSERTGDVFAEFYLDDDNDTLLHQVFRGETWELMEFVTLPATTLFRRDEPPALSPASHEICRVLVTVKGGTFYDAEWCTTGSLFAHPNSVFQVTDRHFESDTVVRVELTFKKPGNLLSPRRVDAAGRWLASFGAAKVPISWRHQHIIAAMQENGSPRVEAVPPNSFDVLSPTPRLLVFHGCTLKLRLVRHEELGVGLCCKADFLRFELHAVPGVRQALCVALLNLADACVPEWYSSLEAPDSHPELAGRLTSPVKKEEVVEFEQILEKKNSQINDLEAELEECRRELEVNQEHNKTLETSLEDQRAHFDSMKHRAEDNFRVLRAKLEDARARANEAEAAADHSSRLMRRMSSRIPSLRLDRHPDHQKAMKEAVERANAKAAEEEEKPQEREQQQQDEPPHNDEM